MLLATVQCAASSKATPPPTPLSSEPPTKHHTNHHPPNTTTHPPPGRAPSRAPRAGKTPTAPCWRWPAWPGLLPAGSPAHSSAPRLAGLPGGPAPQNARLAPPRRPPQTGPGWAAPRAGAPWSGGGGCWGFHQPRLAAEEREQATGGGWRRAAAAGMQCMCKAVGTAMAPESASLAPAASLQLARDGTPCLWRPVGAV